MEDLYMNKSGFKCVRGQLAKTEGLDPQEYEQAKRNGTSLAALKVRALEYVQ